MSKLVLLIFRQSLMNGLFLFLVLTAIIAFFEALIVFQNKMYAHNSFSNKVAYDKVLASRQWHHFFDSQPNCNYAIVSLKKGASHSPPVTWLGNETWYSTPVHLSQPTHYDHATNPVSICVEMGRLSSNVAAKLQTAVKEPSSYYIHFGENLFLYSEPQRIAAIVRYGD